MTQGEAIEAFLKALDDLIESNVYHLTSDYHSYYIETADAKMRIWTAASRVYRCTVRTALGESRVTTLLRCPQRG